MKQISRKEFDTILDYFAIMEACTPCIGILRSIESMMLESGDNKLAKQASKALEAVSDLYQQAGANVPKSFWEDND